MPLKRKNSENTEIRKILEKEFGPRPEEPEITNPPDFRDIGEFLEHLDRLVSDENIDGARSEINKLKNHFIGSKAWPLAVLPIDRNLYDQVLRLREDLKCHSIQSMISAILHDLLLECHTTDNKPRILEHLPKKEPNP